MKNAMEMSKEEYAAAHRAVTSARQGETKREPRPALLMNSAEYAEAKRNAGITR